MRKLTWAAAGFGAAALLAEYALPVQELPYIAAALVPFLGLCFLLKKPARYRALVLLAFFAAGLLAWRGYYDGRVRPCEEAADTTAEITALVTDYPEKLDGYARVRVKVLDGAPRTRAMLYLYEEESALCVPGDIVTGRVRLYSAFQRDGERSHSYTSTGLGLRGYVYGTMKVTSHWGSGLRWFPKTLCRWVEDQCDRSFSPDTAPFMKALLTGNTADLRRDEGFYARMGTAGVLHVVAVSGMHLVILVGFLQLLLGRSRRTSFVCFPVMGLFVLMAGCRASILRAAVMQSFFLLAPLLERESDSATSLGGALLVLLLINPMAIGNVGLQLSFLCVLGFVVLLPPMQRWMRSHLSLMKYPAAAFVLDSGAATVCAVAFSTPVAALYFGTVPLFAAVSNLLTLTVVTVCFAGGLVVCVVGGAWPWLGRVLARVLDWGVRWCRLVYDGVAAVPFACLYTVSPATLVWLFGVYALWGGWLFLRRRGRDISLSVPVCLTVIGLCAVFLSGAARFRPGDGEITVLDVGQGQCVALMDERAAVLVDCGGTKDAGKTAAEYLLASGKNRLDILVLTHLHEDHANGVVTLLGTIPVDTVILPADGTEEAKLALAIRAAAEETGAKIFELSTNCAAYAGDIELAMYFPQAGSDINERGIVLRAELGELSAWIMGDAGMDGEFALMSVTDPEPADVLVVGHHGSAGASGILFLDEVDADTAIVSVGQNDFGLPSPEAMERLGTYCDRILRTDEDGTVTITEKVEMINDGKDGEETFSIQ